MSAEREIWDVRSKKHKLRKNEKDFLFLRRKSYFFKQKMMEIIKNFGQNRDVG